MARVTAPGDPIAVLQRWADAGAVWRVVDRRRGVAKHLLDCFNAEKTANFVTSTKPSFGGRLGGGVGLVAYPIPAY
jgi:hypothetical protein